MKLVGFLCVFLFFAGCHSRVERARDGKSYETAIMVPWDSPPDGSSPQWNWIHRNLPGAKLAENVVDAQGNEHVFLHRLESYHGRLYSVCTLQLTGGQLRDVYFELKANSHARPRHRLR